MPSRVKKEDGTTVELNPAWLSANSVDVCLARELKVSRGDKLLLQANDRRRNASSTARLSKWTRSKTDRSI